MLDILKKDNYEFIESKICDINSKVSDLLNKAKRKEESSNLGQVIDWVRLGYNQEEKNQFRQRIVTRKVAIVKDGTPGIIEVSISATVDYLRVIDTSNAVKEYVLSFDEIIQLAEQQGLFR